ncbi:hypothetical protein HQ560_16400 [bacterium]|nr:hypothetical protein [bacterium]
MRVNALWAPLVVVLGVTGCGESKKALVRQEQDGTLTYGTTPEGDRVIDFSYAGYAGGGVALPMAEVRTTLGPQPEGDDTARIQAAIDAVSKLPLGPETGLRGALLLTKGTYRVAGTLRIAASGVVLRGEGQGADGTVLVAAGTEPRTLVEVVGAGVPKDAGGPHHRVADVRVPVGARTFRLESVEGLAPGDGVIVRRHGNAAWIAAIGMNNITPRPDDPEQTKQWEPFSLDFERTIAAVDGNRITVDAPIPCAIETRWGGGEVFEHDGKGRIERVGVEHIHARSEFDASVQKTVSDKPYPADEAHCRTFIAMDNVQNAWVRNVTARHFLYACVRLKSGCKRVTVQDSSCVEMVSVLTGARRYPFYVEGQLCLVQRCFAKTGRHSFVVGPRVCGPNAFVDCLAEKDYGNSEPHYRWSVGGLYDNVQGDLAIEDRQYYGTGHGWSGANYVVWNCKGKLVCQKPPTAQNYAIGFVGKKHNGSFDKPDGHWESHGEHVAPRSLYIAQLRDRLGEEAVRNVTTPEQRDGALYDLLTKAIRQVAATKRG